MGKAILGIILMVVGALLTIGGALTAYTFGPSGSLQTTSTPLKTTPEGYALVADVVSVSAGFPGSSLLGTPTLGANSAGTERLFVGIGSRADVDDYLTGVSFQAVRQDGSQWQSLSVPGAKKPALPTEESFWIKRATGNEPSVDFATSNGNGTFVIMRADGTPDVRAQILIGYTSRWVFPLSIAALVIGLLLAVEGVVLLRKSRRRDPEEVATAPAAGGGTAGRVDSDDVASAPIAPTPAADPAPDPEDMPEDWFRGPEKPS